MPQSSNVLSFVPIPNLEPGQRKASTHPSHAKDESAGLEDDAVLRKIAEAALSATGAEGAALALRQDGSVVCIARAGEMAPPLGTRLDDQSGMSGECLREGLALRCDDTDTDTRVDAEACRALGLRSLAVAGVKVGEEVIGILEVFSPSPATFNDRHVEVLRQLAELVVAELQSGNTETPVAENPTTSHSSLDPATPQPRLLPTKPLEDLPGVEAGSTPTASPPSQALSATVESPSIPATPLPADVNISAYMAAHEKSRAQIHQRVPKVVLVGLAVLLLAAFVGWRYRHWTPAASTLSVAQPAAPPANIAGTLAPGNVPGVGVDTKPSAEISAATSGAQASAKAPKDAITNAASRDRLANDSVTKPIHVVPSPAVIDAESDAAPPIALGKSDSKGVSDLLGAPVPMPVRAPPTSQGVEGGELDTKVAAIYPPQARAVGQQGTVVLEALVAEDGSVKDVKVVSGPPLLRQAAADAVRLWKYKPYRLNGKAISAQTQVKLEFKLR